MKLIKFSLLAITLIVHSHTFINAQTVNGSTEHNILDRNQCDTGITSLQRQIEKNDINNYKNQVDEIAFSFTGNTYEDLAKNANDLYSAVLVVGPQLLWPANSALNIPTTSSVGWTSLSDAISYEVRFSLNSQFSTTYAGDYVYSGSSYNFNSFGEDKTIFWKVRAYLFIGGQYSWTNWSEVRSFTTVPGIPYPPYQICMEKTSICIYT